MSNKLEMNPADSARARIDVNFQRRPARTAAGSTAVLELKVRNHPGTMSHITGLFARRAFNLEAIACAPVGDGQTSTILLLVADEPRLAQLERELAKLYDVLALRHRTDLGPEFFARCIGAA